MLVRKRLSIVDTHAHLDMAAFNEDRADVITLARECGVATIVSVGTDLQSSREAIELAESHAEVLAAVGFHPHEAGGVSEPDIASLAQLAEHPRVVAIGELGLDFYRDYSPREEQLQALKWQLALAAQLGLPVVIHCRQAEGQMLPLLRDWISRYEPSSRWPRGVIHCFSGDIDTVQQYLDIGFFISFGAYIGYPASSRKHGVIKSIPQDMLVVETDSPFLPPQGRRGKRNEPAFLPLTVELLAEIREVTPEQIAGETTANARRLFRLPGD
jgi:TatD DNase family protein